MTYLDYSATTPVDEEVLSSYVKVTKDFIANPNSFHKEGLRSRELFHKACDQVASILGVKSNELIFTSGASESNSMAIKGIVYKYCNRGKHIITSLGEHKSILDTMNYLSSEGFNVSYVKLLDNGQVDLEDLYNLITDETILISLSSVNSECGYKYPLKTIKQVINKKKSKAFFHSDMTQALGKRTICLSDVDVASFSGHKIYAPKGIGLLYKSEKVSLEPMVFGFTENTPFRGGTPALALIVAFSKALRIINDTLNDNIKYVEMLNNKLLTFFKDYDVRVNSYELCVPHIINISLKKVLGETVVHALENYDIYVSTNTACSSGKESLVLKAVTGDKSISTTSIRISLSHNTSLAEINEFEKAFDEIYRNLVY